MGALLASAGIALFYEPSNIAPGGVSGIAIILHSFFPLIQTGTWIAVFNIPLLFVGWRKLGVKFFISTVFTVLLISVFTNLFSMVGKAGLTNNCLLAAIAGAVLVAVGIGMIFRSGATSGGTDILVKLLKTKYRYMNTGTLFFITDGIIVALSGVAFKELDAVLYAAISVFLQMRVLNIVLYNGDEARVLYIISENKGKIAERILHELGAGATCLKGVGAYSEKERDMLMCVLNMKQLPVAKDIVGQEDAKAFMIVVSAGAVFGGGFKPHDGKEL